MKKISIRILTIFIFFVHEIVAQPEAEIPHAKPGSCYAKCLIADEYTTEKEEIEIKSASSKVEIIPAQFESVTEQILVKEAATRIERIPAEYETVTKSYAKGCPAGYEPERGSLVIGGNCIRYIPVPAVYESVTEQVLVKEAATQLVITPPQYENTTEQILIKPAYTPTLIIPAQYEFVTEQVLVKEASVEIERKPARYKSENEQIEIAPAATKWIKKKGDSKCLSDDCLLWCLVETPPKYQTIIKKIQIDCEEGWTTDKGDCIREVEVPAQYSTRSYRALKTGHRGPIKEIPAEYKTISKMVVKTPAQVRSIDVPAEYATMKRRVMTKAATTRIETAPVIMDTYTMQVRKGCPSGYSEDIGIRGKGDCIRQILIPAEYTNRSFLKLVSPATVKKIPIPAEYTTISRQFLVKKGGFTEWRETNGCGGSVSHSVVRKIQEVLINRGYDPGPANNKMGKKTKTALLKYQKDHNLPVGNLDVKTMRSLGIKY